MIVPYHCDRSPHGTKVCNISSTLPNFLHLFLRQYNTTCIHQSFYQAFIHLFKSCVFIGLKITSNCLSWPVAPAWDTEINEPFGKINSKIYFVHICLSESHLGAKLPLNLLTQLKKKILFLPEWIWCINLEPGGGSTHFSLIFL